MKYRHFSVEERERIQLLLWEKRSVRCIARELHRSPSSIAREINRNIPPLQRRYAPRLAHERALKQRKSRGRKERLKDARIRDYAIARLTQRWSPEQIAGRWSRNHPELRISHEAIYQFIYARVSSANSLPYAGKEDLRPFLRRRHKLRVNKGGRRAWRIMAPHGPSIDTRPAVVALRSRVGDWEGDSVESVRHKPGINTVVERKSGLVCLTKLAGKTAADTCRAVERRLSRIPAELRKTLTLDNGPENSGWRTLRQALDIDIFFAHPYHLWERGTNENTNGLVRDYFPKKTDFAMISETELAYVEWELNNRPRKRLGWRTPLEVFSVALQG